MIIMIRKMKYLLLITLLFIFSCAENNPVNNLNGILSKYEGIYQGKGKKESIYYGTSEEKDITLIVNKDSSVIFKSDFLEFIFDNISKIDDKSYFSMKNESGSLLIFSMTFDGNENVNVSLIIQEADEKYTADKLTKKVY